MDINSIKTISLNRSQLAMLQHALSMHRRHWAKDEFGDEYMDFLEEGIQVSRRWEQDPSTTKDQEIVVELQISTWERGGTRNDG